MSERAALHASLGANALLGFALHCTRESLRDADGWTEFYRAQADENRLNRILIEKVESYGSLIASKLPSSPDR